MNMVFVRMFINTVLVTNWALVIDIFKYKNVHQGVILNLDSDTAITIHKLFRESNLLLSNMNLLHSLVIPYHHQKIGIVLNTSFKDWNDFLNTLDKKEAFRSPFTWIVVTDDLDETTRILSLYPIEVDSDVTIVFMKNNIFEVYEIYNTGFAIGGVIVLRQLGFWNSTLHVEKKNRQDLMGLSLKAAVVITKHEQFRHKTFTEYLETHKPSLDTVDSTHKFKYFELMKYYREMFNITFIFQRTHSWGYTTNGSYDGLVGALQRSECEIGGTPVFVKLDRAKVVDYAAEIWHVRTRFIFRHPKHPGGFFSIYIRPFSMRVWYCMLAFLALSSFALALMLRLRTIKMPGDEGDESASLALLFIWGAVCQQGPTLIRNSFAIKVLAFVMFLFALILYQYYNATVVSTLLHEPPKYIRTMRDLLDSPLKIGVEDILYMKDFFKHTTDPLAIEMYNKRVATGREYNFLPADVGMARVKHGGYAFHLDTATAYRFMINNFSEQELCEFTEVSMHLMQALGGVTRKRSPYIEHIAYAIRKMKERGILHRLQSAWDASHPTCVRTPDSSLITVSLREFSVPLLVLAVGYMASVATLCIETLVWKIGRKKSFIEFRL